MTWIRQALAPKAPKMRCTSVQFHREARIWALMLPFHCSIRVGPDLLQLLSPQNLAKRSLLLIGMTLRTTRTTTICIAC